VRVQLHQLISPGHRGGLDMRKEQMSRHLIHRRTASGLNGRNESGPWTGRLDCTSAYVRSELQSRRRATRRGHDARIIIAPSGGIVLHPRSY